MYRSDRMCLFGVQERNVTYLDWLDKKNVAGHFLWDKIQTSSEVIYFYSQIDKVCDDKH